MAGMLPGVECARRRRFHQGGGGGGGGGGGCSLQQQLARPISESWTEKEKSGDNKLNEVAFEARERLEERLRAPFSSSNKRLDHYLQRHLQRDYGNTYDEEHRGINNGVIYASLITDTNQPRQLVRQNAKPCPVGLTKDCIDLLRREIYTPPRKIGKPLLKLLSRTSEQDDCPICLDCFQLNQAIIHLPCHHRFHSNCLISWLEKVNHCPYCRAKVSNKTSS